MQQNTGLLVGLVVCGVLAVLFGAMFFHANTEVDRLRTNFSGASMETLASDPYNNKNIAALAGERNRLYEAETAKLEAIAANNREVERLKAALEEEERRRQDKAAMIKDAGAKLMADKQKHQATMESAKGMRAAVEKELAKNQEDQRENYNKAYAYVQKQMDNNRLLMERSAYEASRLKTQVAEQRAEMAELQQQLGNFAVEDSGATAAKDADKGDGTVVEADIARRVVMVDLGRLHKVREGMRFNVWRKIGETRKAMGQIELVKVGDATSQALILEQTVQIKRCPLTGWETTGADMRYSPFALTWHVDGAGNYADYQKPPRVPVNLELVKYETFQAMDPLMPIKAGDRISNPLYNPERQDVFLVVGDPMIYSREQIAQAVLRAGGKVVELEGGRIRAEKDYLKKTLAKVNYLILGRLTLSDGKTLSEEDRARAEMQETIMNQARVFGVPYLREARVMDFLEPGS